MGTASGFDAQNAIVRERAPACEKLGILLSKDVVSDHRQTHTVPQTEAKGFDKCSLSRPHRPTNTDHRNMTSPRRRDAPIT
jgi:hypothetical protein